MRLTFIGVLQLAMSSPTPQACPIVARPAPASPGSLDAPQPHGGVVKTRATVRRYRIVTDQGVDRTLFRERRRRPNAFHDQRHLLLARFELRRDDDGAAI